MTTQTTVIGREFHLRSRVLTRYVGVAVVAALAGLPPTGTPLDARQALPAATGDTAWAARIREQSQQAAVAAGAEIGVAMRTLDGSLAFDVNPDTVFHAASTMKVPVMIELFRQADAGRLSLDEHLVITETFRSIMDGSPYTLSAADDSDTALYAALGTRRTLRSLCESMIVVSSNLATNLLIDRVGAPAVRATLDTLGVRGIDVHRGVEDTKAFEAGRNNTTTAGGLRTLLTALADGRVASPEATAEMIAILQRQQFNEGIPAGLPSGVPVAHKTGQITRIHHDAGIVYGPRPYVLVVLVRGVEDEATSGALIAEISRRTWEAVARP